MDDRYSGTKTGKNIEIAQARVRESKAVKAMMINRELPEKVAFTSEGMSWESWELYKMYEAFAETAREEGFEDAANDFELEAALEDFWEQRYRERLKAVREVQNIGGDMKAWECEGCAHIHKAETPPEKCPGCGSKKYQQICILPD